MRPPSFFVGALLAVHPCVAQLFQPAAVEHEVAAMLSEFSSYTSYSPTASVASSTTTHKVKAALVQAAATTSATATATATCAPYWLEDIDHQGIAAFNSDPDSYQVFRNVKDFGATGNGVTDDTAAINLAISSGNRCAPNNCTGSTTTPALVYFPEGTYLISESIVDYYFTQLIGNPNCLPTLKATAGFDGSFGLINGDPYQPSGDLGYGSTNVFWRQIRNFILDMTSIPAASAATGIHWPTAQATSLQNLVFKMSDAPGTQHEGIFIEDGSGGFLTDLVFYGGLTAAAFGNQQFTMRNLTFYNAVTAIDQIWDWAWTYSGISVINCTTGINMNAVGTTALEVGSIVVIDSEFINTTVAFTTAYNGSASTSAQNNLILENVSIQNVSIVVEQQGGDIVLAGTTGTLVIDGWGEGHEYTPTGPTNFQGYITPVSRPTSLITSDGSYYFQSKPQYQNYTTDDFLSARTAGAAGDGVTDDTAALQAALTKAASAGQILFLDQGDYLVTKTLRVPAGSRIVGEAYPVILGSGDYFNNMTDPQPVVRLGASGKTGTIQWTDTLVSTKGPAQGAIMIEYNLAAPAGSPSGMWDVHTRIGGFTGSDLQLAECPTTPDETVTSANIVTDCIAGFLSMYITAEASGLYLENNWFWTADHDVDSAAQTQITVYNGRGLLDLSTTGTVWMVGTAVEHHTLYQYSFVGTQDVFAGMIQTETPYYQPNPIAPKPFVRNTTLHDPSWPTTKAVTSSGLKIANRDAWALRVMNSKDVSIYGAGLYSFFNNYSSTCSDQGAGEYCQTHSVDIAATSSGITLYNLNTVGTHWQYATSNAANAALYSKNLDGYVDTIAMYKSST